MLMSEQLKTTTKKLILNEERGPGSSCAQTVEECTLVGVRGLEERCTEAWRRGVLYLLRGAGVAHP